MSSYSEKYKYICKELTKREREHALGDEYLESIGEKTRLHSPMIIEPEYGILYVRDDAVKDLVAYTAELQKELLENMTKRVIYLETKEVSGRSSGED